MEYWVYLVFFWEFHPVGQSFHVLLSGTGLAQERLLIDAGEKPQIDTWANSDNSDPTLFQHVHLNDREPANKQRYHLRMLHISGSVWHTLRIDWSGACGRTVLAIEIHMCEMADISLFCSISSVSSRIKFGLIGSCPAVTSFHLGWILKWDRSLSYASSGGVSKSEENSKDIPCCSSGHYSVSMIALLVCRMPYNLCSLSPHNHRGLWGCSACMERLPSVSMGIKCTGIDRLTL